ncbi:MAG: hypothetical protein EZS28_015151 [Streblomastix strix]|uniref:Uncharacterized protein n=1 Tax=Streblomastix strix TaxID=222440 RepID=A0A5J4W3N4_9EUKA|nr:MAG: hypothetical protein EZS28_015151 [Streblomastix strix]
MAEFVEFSDYSVVGQLGTELVRSGIALAARSIGRNSVTAIFHTFTDEEVGSKKERVVGMDSGSTVEIDLVVVKTQSNEFLASWFKSPVKPTIHVNNVSTNAEWVLSVYGRARNDFKIQLLYSGNVTDDGCVFSKFPCPVVSISARNMFTNLVSRSLLVFPVAVGTIAAISFPDL